jgi:hypothetical protein
MLRAMGSGPARPVTQVPVPELVGGLDLAIEPLRATPATAPLAALLDNASYWLSFDLARFEPTLAGMPAPLRELAVGIVLRFGETLDGRLTLGDLERFRSEVVEPLPAELAAGLASAADTLARTVAARDAAEARQAEGFGPYAPATALSVHALRASGRSTIDLDGDRGGRGETRVDIGQPLRLSATDERGRPLEPPEIEGPGLILVREAPGVPGARDVILNVPGRYRLRVPGRAEGNRRLLAR